MGRKIYNEIGEQNYQQLSFDFSDIDIAANGTYHPSRNNIVDLQSHKKAKEKQLESMLLKIAVEHAKSLDW